MKRFRCYLEGSSFEVFTDNQILKNFFTKANLSRKECRWLDLLSQFGITKINLKPGRTHVLGDALSRAPQVVGEGTDSLTLENLEVSRVSLSFNFPENYPNDQLFGPIWQAIHCTFPSNKVSQDRINRILHLFSEKDRLLMYEDKVCVPRKFVRDLLYHAHDSRLGGHFAVGKTLSRLERYHWKNKTRDVKNYCNGCFTCQQQKNYQSQKKFTDPTPLLVPTRRWGSLATDFIVKLPKTKKGYDSITTCQVVILSYPFFAQWVDRLSRRVHFIPSKISDSAVDVADAFFSHIFKHHGMPDSIVSDRDPKFTSLFWKHLMKLCDIRCQMASSHHPQTDGLSEVMNRMVKNYLRCFCSLRQTDWDKLLPAAEFAYNSAESEDLSLSPFEVDLGWKPKSAIDIAHKSSTPVESVETFRRFLHSGLQDARFAHQLAKASNSAQSGQRYRPHEYTVSDQVWLYRELFRDAIAKAQRSRKLSARRFGPFRIIELVGKNALHLDLPSNVKLHPIINVDHTTQYKSQSNDIALQIPPRPAPIPDVHGTMLFEVDQILKHRKRGRRMQFLTLMKGAATHKAIWQPTKDFFDADGTLTKVFYDYICEHNLLQNLQAICEIDRDVNTEEEVILQ